VLAVAETHRAPGAESPVIEPRSYAHLAGLLPRALERAIRFDVGAAAIDRRHADPIVDAHATSDVPDEILRVVRDHALSLLRGDARSPQQQDIGRDRGHLPLRSVLTAPLTVDGRRVGVVLVAAFREQAFSPSDEQSLAATVARAADAYRQLETSLARLRLTPRQSQILALIASGLSDKKIAASLGVAHRTVRTHLDRVLREHGLHTRAEAVAAWLRGHKPG
jgi:DNA-binding CsgD family transcriptional regulator